MKDDCYLRFWQRLGAMLGSGVPLMVTLRGFVDELGSTALGGALEATVCGLEQGKRFSDGLARFPGLFGHDIVAMVQAGENQGRLDHVSTTIGELLENGVLSAPAEACVEAEAHLRAVPVPPAQEWPGGRIEEASRLLQDAIAARATEVHIDPAGPGASLVRFRVDGKLEPGYELSRAENKRLVAQLKLMSCLDLAEQMLPQDGRVRIREEGLERDFQVSTSPSVFGEAVCLRFVDGPERRQGPLSLEALAPEKELRQCLLQLVRQSRGLVVCAAPAGAGKKTTLLAMLACVDAGRNKVVSVEDPVGLTLPHVHHVQVRPDIGLTFDATLRHFMRMDPDGVHWSCVQDAKTAALLLRLALTGHLVMSALHARDALHGLERLLGFGLEPYELAEGLLGLISQRLVRRLCPACRRPSEEALASLREFADSAVPANAAVHEPVGCVECHGEGYRGLRAFFELLPMGPRLQQALERGEKGPELVAAARAGGFTTLFGNAIPLLLRAETSLAEVLRACPSSAMS